MKPTKHGHTNYRRLLSLIGDADYRRYESPGYLRLVLENLHMTDCKGRPVYSIAHYDEQNGDLMRDPEITFSLDHYTQAAEPLSFQNDYAGIYEEVYMEKDGLWYFSKSRRIDDDQFLYQWLSNIEHQGYQITQSTTV